MTVTIKDIAKLAGVSHTTVSRALNDGPLINPETKERIKAIAEQQGYIPNFSAKSLVLDRSYNVGLFFSTLNIGTSAAFFYETVRGVNSVIKDRYNLIVRGIDDYQEFAKITRKSFDGILVMSQSPDDEAFIRHLATREIPHVVLNRRVDKLSVPNLLSDDQQGVYGIVEFLIHNGHRSIAIIEGRKGFQSTKERKNGFMRALQDHGLPLPSHCQVQGSYDVESGYKAMSKLLQLNDLPTAVFCSNDDMAVGAMKAITERGLRVPDDISLAGFDDNVYSGYSSPAITTVKRPVEQISKQGALKLLDIIEKRETSAETIYINTELLVRESVRRLEEEKSNG